MEPHEPLYTITEVSARLRCSANTTYQLVRTGKIRGVRTPHAWRIPESSLQAVLAQRRVAQEGEVAQ